MTVVRDSFSQLVSISVHGQTPLGTGLGILSTTLFATLNGEGYYIVKKQWQVHLAMVGKIVFS